MTEHYPAAPQAPPAWNYTPESIKSAVQRSIHDSTALLDHIASLQPQDCTFASVVQRLAIHEGQEANLELPIFLQYVSTDKEIRDEAVNGDKALQDYGLTALTRIDVYQALLHAQKNTDLASLSPDDRRLMDRMILDRTRNGLGLSPDKRESLLAIKKQIMEKAVDFSRNCNEEKGFLLFTAEELEGVPADVIAGFPSVDGKFKVTYKSPDIIPLFKFASLPATRKAAVLGYEGKNIVNAPLLAEIVKLRQQAAGILGYATYADYIIEVKMAKTSKTVLDFLDDLQTKLTPIGEMEKLRLLKLKEEECKERGWKYDGELRLWDYRYYDQMYLAKTLSLDEEAIKAYFPVSTVVPAILNIYQEMLNVKFYRVPESAGGSTWHKDAEMYAVHDAGDGSNSTESFLGYMHLDLEPRENKYGHAAVWGLIPGYEKADGSRNYPVVSMVANLAKATPTRPALMKHNDVVTFFHEMGHAFHGLCSKTKYARFHGTAVARDFVEAPSQMLENWCWVPELLKRMSKHFETKEEISDATIKSIVASKSVNQGLFNLRQLFHGRYDMMVHTSNETQDLTKLWCDLREQVSLVSTDGEYVGGQSSFAHIVGGYEAGYYGYLYSQVFSCDMYETIFEKDPMSSFAGARYRKEILQVGGSRDEMESLKAFLGREPTAESFLKSLLGPEGKVEGSVAAKM